MTNFVGPGALGSFLTREAAVEENAPRVRGSWDSRSGGGCWPDVEGERQSSRSEVLFVVRVSNGANQAAARQDVPSRTPTTVNGGTSEIGSRSPAVADVSSGQAIRAGRTVASAASRYSRPGLYPRPAVGERLAPVDDHDQQKRNPITAAQRRPPPDHTADFADRSAHRQDDAEVARQRRHDHGADPVAVESLATRQWRDRHSTRPAKNSCPRIRTRSSNRTMDRDCLVVLYPDP